VGGGTLGRISRGEQGAGETSPVRPTETVAEVTPAFDCRLAAHTAEFLICDHSALALLDVVLSRVYPTTMAAQQGERVGPA